MPEEAGEGDAILETTRLLLRRMEADDLGPLLLVFSDPETMEFYPAPFTTDQVQAWIDWNLRNYEEHGYGLWALVLKDTGEVIGDCGLTWQRVGYVSSPELEMGWHVRRDLWNCGVATEAAICVRDYARNVLKVPRLIAIVDQRNLASRAISRKVGMDFERIDSFDGKDRMIYSLKL